MWKGRNVWNLPVKLTNLVSDLKYSKYSGKFITKKRNGKRNWGEWNGKITKQNVIVFFEDENKNNDNFS